MGYGFRTDLNPGRETSSPLLGHTLMQNMVSLTHLRFNTLFWRNRKGSPAGLICQWWLCREHETGLCNVQKWPLQCAEMSLWPYCSLI